MGCGHIRWLIRRDMPQVISIEEMVFPYPWSEQEFIAVLGQRNAIGSVIEEPRTDRIVGFMIYELHPQRFQLLSIAVHPTFQRQGYGRALLDKLYGKLSSCRRQQIVTEVRETNLNAQLWLQSCGYVATEVVRSPYVDSPEDAYQFACYFGSREMPEAAK